MKKIIIITIVIALVITVPILRGKINRKPAQTSSPPSKSEPQTTAPVETVSYYYPISDFNGRIKIKSFGTYVRVGDEKKEVCGRVFSGYHTGDDLETTSAEINAVMPIKSIAAGTVRTAETVSGYGGLVVIEHNLNGQIVTAYYGHLNLATLKVQNGQKLTAGEVIGNLGQGCSIQTDFERKHLHFALHKGAAIDVRGYVPTAGQLGDWLDPKQELLNIKASP